MAHISGFSHQGASVPLPGSDIVRAWEGLLGGGRTGLGGPLAVRGQIFGPPHSVGLSTVLSNCMSTLRQQVLANPDSTNILTNHYLVCCSSSHLSEIAPKGPLHSTAFLQLLD